MAARSVDGLTGAELADLVHKSVSGRELCHAGYGEDVDLAVELDTDPVVPLLQPAAPGGPGGPTAGFRSAPPPAAV
jgi:phosphosulfolactate phosphohydrolase-like enzyme